MSTVWSGDNKPKILTTRLKKRALIRITEHIQTHNSENPQGQCIYVIEVVADSFQMLESCQERGNIQLSQPAASQNIQYQNSLAAAHEPFPNSEPMNLNDDDLTF